MRLFMDTSDKALIYFSSMARPLSPRRKPNPEQSDPALWRNPYLLLAGLGALALSGVTVYHFAIRSNVISDQTGSGGSGFSLFGRGVFSSKPSLELGGDDLEKMGISSGSRKAFIGVQAENFREKRRLFALQKYEGIRTQADERRKLMVESQLARSTGFGAELKSAFSSLQDADNLGIMKIENLLQVEVKKGGMGAEKLDMMIHAYQTLAETYARKQMKEKARGAYMNVLRLMKERAPAEQEAQFNDAIGQVEAVRVTAPDN